MVRSEKYSGPKRRKPPLADFMEAKSAVLAPDIRRERGDVKLEQYAIEGPGGGVIGAGKRDRVQSMLGRYRRRGEISERQYIAGEKLAEYAEQMQAGAGKSCLDIVACSDSSREAAIVAAGAKANHATLRYRDAARAVGPILWPVIEWVAIQGKAATDWATSESRAKTDGIAALRLGLDALVQWADG